MIVRAQLLTRLASSTKRRRDGRSAKRASTGQRLFRATVVTFGRIST